jgi:hypothetical protein
MKFQIVYGLYKGDEFIDVGTAEELASKFGVAKNTIYSYASAKHKNKNKNDNFIVAVKFKEAI